MTSLPGTAPAGLSDTNAVVLLERLAAKDVPVRGLVAAVTIAEFGRPANREG